MVQDPAPRDSTATEAIMSLHLLVSADFFGGGDGNFKSCLRIFFSVHLFVP